MEKQLYFIENMGCDATTFGIIELTDNELKKIVEMCSNLNKNSTYGCMPVISIYRTKWEYFKEVTNLNGECWDDDFVDKEERYYINNKCYTFIKRELFYLYRKEFELILNGNE